MLLRLQLGSIFNHKERREKGESLGINERKSSVLMGISKLLESMCKVVQG